MIKTVVDSNLTQKLCSFVMLVGLMVIMPLQSVLAQGTYYVGGSGALDTNPGTNSQPFLTIQKAASVAASGSVVNIRSGTYRETITPVSDGITFQADLGAAVIISGLNDAGSTGWTIHAGQIYKKTLSLPLANYSANQHYITSNTTIVANQIFKDGAMMFEARYPKISSETDLLDQHKWRHAFQGSNTALNNNTGYSFQPTSITDNILSTLPNLAGGKLFINGWFVSGTRNITSHSGNVIQFSQYFDSNGENPSFRKWWYVTGKLGLLTDEKEWHYEGGVLYFRQPGGGSPTGVEYKARNWGFDLRNKSNIKIIGIQFFGCEVATGNSITSNTVVDNVRAKYTNHTFLQEQNSPNNLPYWYTMSQQTGLMLIGSNNLVKNSEFDYAASQVIWLGEGGKVSNCKFTNTNYEGNYGSCVAFWGTTGGQTVENCTASRLGRSFIDLSNTVLGSHLNVNIQYNDISDFAKISVDVGAIYAGAFQNTTGSVIHHNWIHDAGTYPDFTGHRLAGIMTSVYWDQGSGPATFHHNVCWGSFSNLAVDAADFYILSRYTGGDGTSRENTTSSFLYNNTFASPSPYSYVTYNIVPLDVQRNNIYRPTTGSQYGGLVFNWGASTGDVLNSIKGDVNPLFVNSGGGGLNYQVQSGSPAVNAGIAIPGITDGSVGTPDIGAYEVGGVAWVAGYVQVPQPVQVSGVSISPSTVTVAVGATSQLTKTISPANATNQNVTWSTSSPSIATVSSTGLVTTVAAGTITITATSASNPTISGTSTITVTGSGPSPLIALRFNETSGAPLNTGTLSSTFTRSATTPVNSTNVPTTVGGARSLDFGTTTGNYYVESTGIIDGLKNLSSFTITGWLNAKSNVVGSGGNRIVSWSWIPNGADGVDLVHLGDGKLVVGIDEFPDVSTATSSPAKLTFNASAPATNWVFFAVTYQSASSEVKYYFGNNASDATLDVTRTYNRGAVGSNIQKLAIGHFNDITRPGALDRMFKGLIDEIQIHGSALTLSQIVGIQRGSSTTIPVTGVSVSPPTASLQIGGTTTIQLTKTISPANATNQNVTWSTSSPSIATVSSTGLVTAVAAGTVTITATTADGSFTSTSSVTVAATGIALQNGEFDSGTSFWSLVDYTTPATASITVVTNAALSGTNALRVDVTNTNNTEWMLQLVNQLNFRLTVGKTYRLSFMAKAESARTMAVALAGNGNNFNYFYTYTPVSLTTTAQTYTFDYNCTDAGVNGEPNFSLKFYLAKGVISDIWLDKVSITDITAGTSVTGVSVSPSSLSLTPGQTGQLTKTITPSNATNQNVTWTSSNTGVATVNTSGLVTAVAAGTTTITATTQDGSFTATAAITVNTITIIDDAVIGTGINQFNYVGTGWVHGSTTPTFYNSTLSYSNVTNNTATLSFVGNKIEWYTENLNTQGIAAVSIDNGTETFVDLYAATGVQQLLVYSSITSNPLLAQGSHTFKIRATGTKNPLSSNYYAIHDFVKVYSSAGGGGGGGEQTVLMEESLRAYPNPIKSGQIFYLELPNVPGEVNISDVMGKPKYSVHATEMKLEIPTKELSHGMYLLHYRSSKGLKSVKILIE